MKNPSGKKGLLPSRQKYEVPTIYTTGSSITVYYTIYTYSANFSSIWITLKGHRSPVVPIQCQMYQKINLCIPTLSQVSFVHPYLLVSEISFCP